MGKIERLRIKRNFNEKLTPGETLLIWRRRMEWTQAEAANYYGVSIFRLKLAEYDKAKDFPYKNNLKITLRPNEKCLLYRKRAKLTQPQVATEFGIGRYWLRLQETGKVPCARLLSWWENK